MAYESEGKEILELVGGAANVRTLAHCVTRLRFELKDSGKAETEKIKALSYVFKVVESGGQYQIVIGPAVTDYYDAVLAAMDQAEVAADGNSADGGDASKQKPLDVVLKVISGAFSPIIPLMAGSGMIKAVLTLLTTLGWLSDASSTYLVLSAAGNACFYFLPVFLGFTISKQLGADGFVGAAIGAALLEPNFTGLIGVENTDFLGIGLQAVSYGSTHGDYPEGYVPTFHFDIVEKIKAATGVPLVLHGGSGAGDENMRRSVEVGINKINVGTDYMIAQREFVAKTLAEDPGYDWPQLLQDSWAAGMEVVKRYIELSGSANKAF